jgi:hypothetical protein
MHPGLGNDGAGMSRVRLNTLDLPASEEETLWQERQAASRGRPRACCAQSPAVPVPSRVTMGREAIVIRKG